MISRIIESYQKFKEVFLIIMSEARAECVVPANALETLVRCILPDITKFFENEENQQLYEQHESENTEPTHLTEQTN